MSLRQFSQRQVKLQDITTEDRKIRNPKSAIYVKKQESFVSLSELLSVLSGKKTTKKILIQS
jgi:hypothetical protein